MVTGRPFLSKVGTTLHVLIMLITVRDEFGSKLTLISIYESGMSLHASTALSKMAIGREVFSCHPPKIEQRVRGIIDEFRAGKLDKVPVWMEKNGKTMLVTYMAVRNKDNEYLGTMELVQDMEFAKEHFTK